MLMPMLPGMFRHYDSPARYMEPVAINPHYASPQDGGGGGGDGNDSEEADL